MSGHVDVLAFFDVVDAIHRDALRGANSSRLGGDGEAAKRALRRLADKLEATDEARDAVAELIAAAGSCAEAFADFLEAEVPDVIARDYPSYVRLRAALARLSGAPQ